MQYDELIQKIQELQLRVKKIYVYGAGFYGQDLCRILLNKGIKVEGFLVTKTIEKDYVMNLPVRIAETELNNDIGIILGMSKSYTKEVILYLERCGFNKSNFINGAEYIIDSSAMNILRDNKVIEVSVVMGCTVNCKYCPQEVLLKEYYKHDKNRKRIMTIRDFERILNNTPDDCVISFAGMTEPFNNPNCLEMIEMACDIGRKVLLYSTFSGIDEETVNKLLHLPIFHVTFHAADKYNYAHVLKTDEYYQIVNKIINSQKKDGRPFVDYISAQAEPDEKIAKIIKGKFEIAYSLTNRAGNIDSDDVEHRIRFIDKGNIIKCSAFGDDISCNVVLPDGTVVLCGSDYGMKHVLGNLYEEDYEKIRSKGEFQRILRELNGGSDMNLLCRNCIVARDLGKIE